MFREPRNNLIESDDFAVEFSSAWALTYREGDRSIVVDMELTSVPGCAIQESSIDVWAPDGTVVSRAERLNVIRNIEAAFTWRGLQLAIVPPLWPSDDRSVLDD